MGLKRLSLVYHSAHSEQAIKGMRSLCIEHSYLSLEIATFSIVISLILSKLPGKVSHGV